MNAIERAGRFQALWLPSVAADTAFPRSAGELLPMPGQPIQAHLRELYPQQLMERLRLSYASPEQELRALYDPQRFAATLDSLVRQLLDTQACQDRQAAVLLQALLADRHMLAYYVTLLLKV
ncbi:hypothetical protein [Pseudomonas mosselii]|uniref:type III secretion apparatus assembly protein SctX n=1 Tax=Pseudomonas mosselii TaxID=78327 RepID=UPI000C12C061|nr:hypothetical protein [Pseudomonas mosselii]MDH1099766.1 hypothetical protein [Pseudomonas mosselii]UVN46085.1 hypothetical protein NW905_08830 [Pseudomonas mosselii]